MEEAPPSATSRAKLLPQEPRRLPAQHTSGSCSAPPVWALVQQLGPDTNARLFKLTFHPEMDQMLQCGLRRGSAAATAPEAKAVL